ncbi:hypothetical protein CCACVL1_19858 [Corchorus capsularis]|uniref:Uncharacterized protein n=1 Tax=Corchorus capsularis TaxID=210143 RepID=A0A1R3HEF4_COCAP|nr:hypothetical protein CCACVL1_19858 [Corchorus capsularis]
MEKGIWRGQREKVVAPNQDQFQKQA